MLRLAHREVPYGRYVEARMREMVGQCMATGAVLLSLSRGTPVGTLGLELTRPRWSDDLMLQEVWVFVHPEHRRAPHARTLLRAAKDTARAAQMRMLIGVTSTIRTQGKMRLFEREFGAPVGANYLFEG